MATTTINVTAQIHAEIDGGDKTALSYSPIIIDPITKSYSTTGDLIYYRLTVKSNTGLINPEIWHNGKNSRFVAGGSGSCVLELLVRDENGNTDTDEITITLI